jgi:hypothetical protein
LNLGLADQGFDAEGDGDIGEDLGDGLFEGFVLVF